MNWIKQKIMSYVVGCIFESKYGKMLFGWANGHKTEIGRAISFVSLVILAAQSEFPQAPWLVEANAIFGFVTGFIITELGLDHKALKRNIEVIKLQD